MKKPTKSAPPWQTPPCPHDRNFLWDGRGGVLIEAAGHDGQAGKGRDVVCAGISSLIFAEIDLTRKMESEGDIQQRTAVVRKGFMYLYVRPRKN